MSYFSPEARISAYNHPQYLISPAEPVGEPKSGPGGSAYELIHKTSKREYLIPPGTQHERTRRQPSYGEYNILPAMTTTYGEGPGSPKKQPQPLLMPKFYSNTWIRRAEWWPLFTETKVLKALPPPPPPVVERAVAPPPPSRSASPGPAPIAVYIPPALQPPPPEPLPERWVYPVIPRPAPPPPQPAFIPSYQKTPTYLLLTVVSASKLVPMDIKSSDPYVVISADGRPSTLRTRAVPNNLNPVWNETFHLDVPTTVKNLVFTVWDSDNWGEDDFEGQAVMDVSKQRHSGNFTTALGPRHGSEEDRELVRKNKSLGTLVVALQWSITRASPMSIRKL